MRRSVHLLAIAICLASVPVLAQDPGPRATRQPVEAADSPTPHARVDTSHRKSKSVFGQAIAELTRSVEETRAKQAAAQGDTSQQANPAPLAGIIADSGPEDIAVARSDPPRD